MNKLFETYGDTHPARQQAIYTSIFILQNRLQTAGEKVQDAITMKQRLLLTMMDMCPKPHTLTHMGEYMGCSRQNAKKLAAALAQKGYLRLIPGDKNSIHLELTEQAVEAAESMEENHLEILKLLFADFSEEDIQRLFFLYGKLYKGIERVENYVWKE